MLNMFDGCSTLKSLNISNFTVENETTVEEMFKNCSNLVSVKVAENDNIATALGNGWTYDNGVYARWGVTGDFAAGSNWNSDVVMLETEQGSNIFVSPAITFNANEVFKIRLGGDWNKNYGIVSTDNTERPSVIELDTAVTAISKGKNIKVSAGGNYIITLNLGTPAITVTVATE